MDLTTITMTKEEFEQYKLFKRHKLAFILMQEGGVFEIKFGKCILNFYKGNLQNIVREEMIYSAVHQKQA